MLKIGYLWIVVQKYILIESGCTNLVNNDVHNLASVYIWDSEIKLLNCVCVNLCELINNFSKPCSTQYTQMSADFYGRTVL